MQKKIEYLKELRERNVLLAQKLREVQSKAIAKMKHNDSLCRNFKCRKSKMEEQATGIVGVSFYNYEVEHRIPRSLETYFELQIPKEKQSIFLKNVFESTSQPELPLSLADSSIKLEEIVKKYPANPSGIPFDRIGVFYGVSGLRVH